MSDPLQFCFSLVIYFDLNVANFSCKMLDKSCCFMSLSESEAANVLTIQFWQSVLALFAFEHVSEQLTLLTIHSNTQF